MISRRLLFKYSSSVKDFLGYFLKQSLYPKSIFINSFDGCKMCYDLGSGDGILTNLLALSLPSTKWIGIDKNKSKVNLSNNSRLSKNIIFKNGNFLKQKYQKADGFLFNDVLHHISNLDKVKILKQAFYCLNDNGIVFIKDVNAEDYLDKNLTSFWDKKIYPNDCLSFLRRDEWISLFRDLGFEILRCTKVKHPWIASRSIYILAKNKRVNFCTNVQHKVGTIVKQVKKSSILLTGASGFIGEHLLYYLSNCHKLKIIVFGQKKSALISRLIKARKIVFFKGNLKNTEDLKKIHRKIDYVFHLASKVNYFGNKSILNDNLLATKNIINLCKSKNIKKLVYTSTFGAVDRKCFDWNYEPLNENSKCYPTSFYGKGKLLEEQEILNCGLNVAILRLPWVYGPGMNVTHHLRKILFLVKKKSFVLKFKWPGRVSLLSVNNCIVALILSMFKIENNKKTIFITDKQPIEFWKIINNIQNQLPWPSRNLIAIPKCFVFMAKVLQFILPFPLKCMLFDAYSVDIAASKQHFFKYFDNQSFDFRELIRFDALTEFPSRLNQRTLITGSSSGIGLCLKNILYCCGFSLILVDKRKSTLKHDLISNNSCTFIKCNLANEIEVKKLLLMIRNKFNNLKLFINNAAIGLNKSFMDQTYFETKLILKVNIFSSLRLLHACAKKMSDNCTGIIINIASSISFLPFPTMSIYAASKAFISSFSSSLTEEMNKSNICIKTIYPSGCKTNFQKASKFLLQQKYLLSPNFVAQKICKNLYNNKQFIFVGFNSFLFYLIGRIIPLKYQPKIIAFLIKN